MASLGVVGLCLVGWLTYRRSKISPHRAGPWSFHVEPTMLPDSRFTAAQVESIADALNQPAPGQSHLKLDVERTVQATVELGGYPTPVYAEDPPAPRILVLLDEDPLDAPWRPMVDELLGRLRRSGVELESYGFYSEPVSLIPHGWMEQAAQLLHELRTGHFNALLVVGQGDAGTDPLTGQEAPWIEELVRFKRVAWINPLPPSRWSAGARVVARKVPMSQATSHEIVKICRNLAAVVEGDLPPVIDQAPSSKTGLLALKEHLGPEGFRWLAAAGVAPSPTVAWVEWVGAELIPSDWNEEQRLALLSLPWIREGAWPPGLREALLRHLRDEEGALEGSVRASLNEYMKRHPAPVGSHALHQQQLEQAILQVEERDATGLELLGFLRPLVGKKAVANAARAAYLSEEDITSAGRLFTYRLARCQGDTRVQVRAARPVLGTVALLLIITLGSLGYLGYYSFQRKEQEKLMQAELAQKRQEHEKFRAEMAERERLYHEQQETLAREKRELESKVSAAKDDANKDLLRKQLARQREREAALANSRARQKAKSRKRAKKLRIGDTSNPIHGL